MIKNQISGNNDNKKFQEKQYLFFNFSNILKTTKNRYGEKMLIYNFSLLNEHK